jgi:bile acid-coenzyme A ligase
MLSSVICKPFGDLIGQHARETPTAPALTCGNQSLTWSELDSRTNQRARAFARRGVTADSLVVIALPNSVEVVECAVATWKLGATPLVLPYAMPSSERGPILDLARPALVVDRATEDSASPPPPDRDWRGEDDTPLPSALATRWRASTSGGSTGRPKLIFTESPAATDPDQRTLRLRRGGCEVIPGPLYHGAPFLFTTYGLMRGKHVVLLPKFGAQETLRAISAFGADFVLLVPTMMNRISKLPAAVRDAYDVFSLEVVLHLGGSCPPDLKRDWIGWLGPQRIHELYAGTEGQAMTWITGAQWLEHPGSVGRPVGGAVMRAFDPAFTPLPPGEIGEIFMRAPDGTAPAYSYAGAQARARDGWESLGDLGWVDGDGFVYIVDRRADMIVSGGANVYPAEVEAAIEAHPDVSAAVVVGLPDADLGRRVHAFVEPLPGTREILDESVLRDFLASRLVRYKVPRAFQFVDGPLRDEAGKVRRSTLASLAETN